VKSVRKLLTGQPFDPEADSRRARGPGLRKQGVEIGIQCDNNPIFKTSPLEDIRIIGLRHANFAHMNSIMAALVQPNCRRARNTLIE